MRPRLDDGLPRHVKRVRTRAGERFRAAVRVPLGVFLTREEAAEAVAKRVPETFPPDVAAAMIARPKE